MAGLSRVVLVVFAVLGAAALLVVAPARALSWEVDPAYSGTRSALVANGGVDVIDGFVLSDGRVMSVAQSGGDAVVKRFHSAGGTDESYAPGLASFRPSDADIDGAGRVLVAGTNQYDTMYVTRFGLTGLVDATFTYPSTIGFPYSQGLAAVANVPSGKTLAAGVAGGKLFVTRLDSTLQLDAGYGANGIATHSVGPGLQVHAIAVAADGTATIAAELANPMHSDPDVAVFRVTPDGDLDTSFGGDGIVAVDLTEASGERSWDQAGALVLNADGSLVIGVARFAGTLGDGDDGFLVLRIAVDGALDGSFGGERATLAPSFGVSHLERDGDGYLASGGSGSGQVVTARFGAAGLVDTGFGTGGLVALTVYQSQREGGETRRASEGRLVVIGEVGSNDLDDELFVARLRPSSAAPPPTQPPPTQPPPTTTAPPSSAPTPNGYWMVSASGEVFAFGDAVWRGNAPVGAFAAVDIERTPSGSGYWVLDSAGHVFSFGDADYLGGASGLGSGEAVTSMSAQPAGGGYWLFTNWGRVLPFGNALSYGDMAATRLNGPVLDSVSTPTGDGYYMVASDGGLFTFGDAVFAGSMGDHRLNAPVQSVVPDMDGGGYWLVASDGGIFAFQADFYGSMGSARLNEPITGMVAFRRGYLMVAEDGGIFTFGEAVFRGSLGANPPARPIAAVTTL